MTALYRISIEDKNDATVHGRFYMINPDAGILPEDDQEGHLPMDILIDAWERMKHGRFDQLPIPRTRAAEIADRHVLAKAFQEELDNTAEPGEDIYDRLDEVIKSSEVSEQRNRPAFWEAEGFWDTCTDDDFPKDVTAWPYVEFTFTAHDARYVAHMIPGTHWETAQYLM